MCFALGRWILVFDKMQPVFGVEWENDRLQYRVRLVSPEDKVVIAYDDTPLQDMYDQYVFSTHTHDFYEIEYILSGSGVQRINDTEHRVNKGDIVFLSPNDEHTYYPDHGIQSFDVINCVFQQIPVNLMERSASIPSILSLTPPAIIEIDQIFSKMQKEYDTKEMGYQDMLNAYLNEVLIHVFRESKRQSDLSLNAKVNISMVTILEYIERNYQHATLKKCADYVSYSSAYFCKLFKENVGMTLTEYVNKKKIQASMTLLLETDQSIESIIMNTGFNHRKYFYLLFRDYTGMTPNEFRNRNHGQR
jgi:AraC-like DNA-binding protein